MLGGVGNLQSVLYATFMNTKLHFVMAELHRNIENYNCNLVRVIQLY